MLKKLESDYFRLPMCDEPRRQRAARLTMRRQRWDRIHLKHIVQHVRPGLELVPEPLTVGRTLQTRGNGKQQPRLTARRGTPSGAEYLGVESKCGGDHDGRTSADSHLEQQWLVRKAKPPNAGKISTKTQQPFF